MTPTEISNLALSQLPAGPIVGLDENSVAARECKRWYRHVLETLLQQGPWRFSRRLAALAGLDDSDREPYWLYRYAAPADMSFVLCVYDETMSLKVDYDYVGAYVYTNDLAPQIEYISRNDPVAQAGALFRSALIAALAAPICMPVIKSPKRQRELSDAAESALQRAQAFNHNEADNRYGDFIPAAILARAGASWEHLRFPGPEAVYPDFNPLGVYEEALDD
jgi:hypothetical protein